MTSLLLLGQGRATGQTAFDVSFKDINNLTGQGTSVYSRQILQCRPQLRRYTQGYDTTLRPRQIPRIPLLPLTRFVDYRDNDSTIINRPITLSGIAPFTEWLQVRRVVGSVARCRRNVVNRKVFNRAATQTLPTVGSKDRLTQLRRQRFIQDKSLSSWYSIRSETDLSLKYRQRAFRVVTWTLEMSPLFMRWIVPSARPDSSATFRRDKSLRSLKAFCRLRRSNFETIISERLYTRVASIKLFYHRGVAIALL
jgi:hypothetical protein